jgi:hypothetical protein
MTQYQDFKMAETKRQGNGSVKFQDNSIFKLEDDKHFQVSR